MWWGQNFFLFLFLDPKPANFFLFFKYQLFIYFWLHQVLVAAGRILAVVVGFSLVAEQGVSRPVACGILPPWPRIKPESPALEGKFLTTGLPEKSQKFVFFFSNNLEGNLGDIPLITPLFLSFYPLLKYVDTLQSFIHSYSVSGKVSWFSQGIESQGFLGGHCSKIFHSIDYSH